jgi:hypothetical protein
MSSGMGMTIFLLDRGLKEPMVFIYHYTPGEDNSEGIPLGDGVELYGVIMGTTEEQTLEIMNGLNDWYSDTMGSAYFLADPALFSTIRTMLGFRAA